MSMSSSSLRCPHCGQTDQVAKVSAIYKGGLSHSNFSGTSSGGSVISYGNQVGTGTSYSYHNISGTQQSELSQLLSPPPRPRLQYAWSALTIWLLGFLFLISLCSCYLSDIAGAWGVVGFLVLVGLAVFIIVQKARKGPQYAAENQAKMATWQRQMHNWELLYYCNRDDVVFIPNQPQTCCPAEDMYYIL